MKLALFFFPVLDISGMMFNDLTAKHITVDMRVDFGGSSRLMCEQGLNSPLIGSTFQYMSGEGMSESMRTDVFGNACFFR